MIKKLRKIKGLGIFKNFVWDSQVHEFKRYNLIYGWNGCGKTTLSKLFWGLANGSNSEFPDLEYEVETESGTIRQGSDFPSKVKVFNQDYIADNIELLGGKAKPIFILGEENKITAEQIETDEKTLALLLTAQQEKETAKASAQKFLNKHFSDIAKVIGANSSGSALRTYRKNNAEDAFEKLPAKHLLSEEELARCQGILKQSEKNILKPAQIGTVTIRGNEIPLLEAISYLYTTAVETCEKTVESSTIQRLKENSHISNWVESGLAIHQTEQLKDCEFCGGSLSDSRIKSLLEHFNEADKNLKNDIALLLGDLTTITQSLSNISFVDKANLYNEFEAVYQSAIEDFYVAKQQVIQSIEKIAENLENKRNRTTESLKVSGEINTASLIQALDLSNQIINKHNSVTNNFAQEKRAAETQLETHYLSEIYDDVKSLNSEVQVCDSILTELREGIAENPEKPGITELKRRITENRSKITSEHEAGEEINNRLATFLGRKELVFEVAPEGGYLIKRHGQIAKSLSEGEKTAIAFVYFVVHLKDKEFDLENGIVIIDDPISSLDSNSLFQAFAFLKNAVKDAKQVFLLTHNFEFLRLLLNWMNYVKTHSGFYMITNKYAEADGRIASIANLDPTLKNHESEYHYLFKKLYEFESDGTLENVYNVPNLARKVLETFLMFRVPNSEKIYKKLEKLAFDEDKKTAIYKFTNDQSHLTGHGFNPALITETQNNVKYLLEMMEVEFPEHYKILRESVT